MKQLRRNEDELLTPAEVAARLKVSMGTLHSLRKRNVLHPIQVGPKCLRYSAAEVELYVSGVKKN